MGIGKHGRVSVFYFVVLVAPSKFELHIGTTNQQRRRTEDFVCKAWYVGEGLGAKSALDHNQREAADCLSQVIEEVYGVLQQIWFGPRFWVPSSVAVGPKLELGSHFQDNFHPTTSLFFISGSDGGVYLWIWTESANDGRPTSRGR